MCLVGIIKLMPASQNARNRASLFDRSCARSCETTRMVARLGFLGL